MNKRGFTLIEVLVAMSIFMAFTGILISSYSSIIREQREANEYRVLYSEARRVFDKLTEEIRDNVVDYSSVPKGGGVVSSYNGAMHELSLISKDGLSTVSFSLVEDGILFNEKSGVDDVSYSLTSTDDNEQVRVTEFNVFISPAGDPYHSANVFADALQFQPKVTVYAEFEKDKIKGGEPYVIDFQTTISSRFYSVSPNYSN